MFKQICDGYGLRQLVDVPTRGPYLLDLCLSDLDYCKVKVGTLSPIIMDSVSKLECLVRNRLTLPGKFGISEKRLGRICAVISERALESDWSTEALAVP